MPTNLIKGDKKKALAAYKDKILTEISYYDQRIAEARNNFKKSSTFEENESSDSDSEFSLLMDSGPSMAQLKSQHAMLKTCLEATHELTNLEVLQSEVNILVQPPVFEGESPISQPGTWREVTAECCFDLVPFSITFYAHRGEGKFAPIQYRGLKVSPLKDSQKPELVESVLKRLRRPSDAVEVLRSYAQAHRSRRSTLARLTDKFGVALFMEPLASGGYRLKCENLLEISWRLSNERSPVAPFYHRLNFDIEYIDEPYLKTITSAHRQLSDPSIDTDERTLLLAKIISTCLSARPLQDSSDQEAQNNSPVKDGGRLEKRRITLDREPDPPNTKKNKDSEVMAPPKSLPKKVKPKNKSPSENKISVPKPAKRLIHEEPSNDNSKKAKIDNGKENPKADQSKKTETTAKNSKAVASDKNVRNVNSDNNKEGKITANNKPVGDKANVDKAKDTDVNKESAGKTQNTESAKKVLKTDSANKVPPNTEKPNKNYDKKREKEANKKNNDVKHNNVENVAKCAPVKRKSIINMKTNTKQPVTSKVARKSASSTSKKVNNDKNNPDRNEKNSIEENTANNAKITGNVEKLGPNKVITGKVIKVVNNITNEKGEVVKNVIKKHAKVSEKVIVANEPKTNLPKKSITVVNSGVKMAKTGQKRPLNEQNTKSSSNHNMDQKGKKTPPKVSIFTANSGKTSSGTIEKENTSQNKNKYSKIPQKKITTPKSHIKKMTVRMSPRNPISKAKPPQAGVNLKKIVQKPVTGIPRLLTKSKP